MNKFNMDFSDFETPADRRENLYQEIAESKEWKLIEKISALTMSYYIFKENWKELAELMNDGSSTEIPKFRSVQEGREHQKNVMRCLHNFTSAIKTLVDHTRVLTNSIYSKMDFGEECKAFGKEIGTLPMVRFLQDLRNYIVHRKIPDCTGCVISTKKVFLSVDKLLEWNGWSRDAYIFLKEYEETNYIDILGAVNDYAMLIKNFYTWFSSKQQKIHRKEFLKISLKLEELGNMYYGTSVEIWDLKNFLLESEI